MMWLVAALNRQAHPLLTFTLGPINVFICICYILVDVTCYMHNTRIQPRRLLHNRDIAYGHGKVIVEYHPFTYLQHLSICRVFIFTYAINYYLFFENIEIIKHTLLIIFRAFHACCTYISIWMCNAKPEDYQRAVTLMDPKSRLTTKICPKILSIDSTIVNKMPFYLYSMHWNRFGHGLLLNGGWSLLDYNIARVLHLRVLRHNFIYIYVFAFAITSTSTHSLM